MILFIQTVALLAVTFACGMYDQKYQRIPNLITLPAMAAGFLLSTTWKEALFKVVLCACLYMIGMTGLIGSGDIKLLMAVACLYGLLPSAFIFILAELIFLASAIISYKSDRENMKNFLFWLLVHKKIRHGYKWGRYPFAMSMFLASLLIAYLRVREVFPW